MNSLEISPKTLNDDISKEIDDIFPHDIDNNEILASDGTEKNPTEITPRLLHDEISMEIDILCPRREVKKLQMLANDETEKDSLEISPRSLAGNVSEKVDGISPQETEPFEIVPGALNDKI